MADTRELVDRLDAAYKSGQGVGQLWNLLDEAVQEIERQQAEIERLKETLSRAKEIQEATAACWRDDAAEIGVLRKDAERYDFLRADFSPMGVNIDGNHAWAYRRNATLKGPSLDAAIDAAKEKA